MEPSLSAYGLMPMAVLSAIVYSIIGFVVFGLAFLVILKISPFSIAKEISEDQNIALAIIIGSVFLSLSLIIQAAIRG